MVDILPVGMTDCVRVPNVTNYYFFFFVHDGIWMYFVYGVRARVVVPKVLYIYFTEPARGGAREFSGEGHRG